jgi:hypothetical protein
MLVLLSVAATPEHPGHMVRLDRLQQDGAVDGQFLQWSQSLKRWRPVDGVVPTFVDNASLAPAAGAPAILRDSTTGVLTLPSAPNAPLSLALYVNGVRQAFGKDYTLSGTLAVPEPDQVLPDGSVYSPQAAFLAATEIVADYRR